MTAVDAAVLKEFEKVFADPQLVDRVIELACDMAEPAKRNARADKAASEAALRKVEQEIQNLTDVLASGGADVKAVVTA